MQRKLVAAVLVLLLLGLAVPARALLPIAVGPGVWITFQSGAMATSYATAMALIGSLVWFYEAPQTDGSQSGLRVHLTEDAPQDVPDGWSANADPSLDPSPPSTTSGVTAYTCQGGGSPVYNGSSPAGACSAWFQGQFAASLCPTYNPTSGICARSFTYNTTDGHGYYYTDKYCTSGPCVGGYNTGELIPEFSNNLVDYGVLDVGSSVSCPTGYTQSGGSCVVQTPSAVPYPEDGRCLVRLASGVYTNHPRDPDCSNLDGASVSGLGTANYQYQTRGGELIDVDYLTDGSQLITVSAGNKDGTSTVTELKIGPGKRLAGGSQERVTGEGVLVDNQQINQIGNCGGPGQNPCSVTVNDSGFNNAASGLGSAVDAVGGAYTAREGQVSGLDSQGNYGVDSSWLPDLRPGAVQACQAIAVDMNFTAGALSGLSVSEPLDICDKLDVPRQIMGYLFGLWAVWSIFGTFVNANGGRTS